MKSHKLRRKWFESMSRNQKNNMKNPTVEQLKSQGYRVDIRYTRYDKPTSVGFMHFSGKPLFVNAVTRATLVTPEGEELSGIAFCGAGDNFCRRSGRTIAINRALNHCEPNVDGLLQHEGDPTALWIP